MTSEPTRSGPRRPSRSATVRISRRCRGDRGTSDALGLALIAPAALGLALVVLSLGRQVDSRATAQIAAESGAQAAAQERTPAAAVGAATEAARSMLTDSLTCAAPTVSVDTTRFAAGGVVAVTVTCTASSSGLEPIDASPSSSSATAYATIDPFRATDGS